VGPGDRGGVGAALQAEEFVVCARGDLAMEVVDLLPVAGARFVRWGHGVRADHRIDGGGLVTVNWRGFSGAQATPRSLNTRH